MPSGRPSFLPSPASAPPLAADGPEAAALRVAATVHAAAPTVRVPPEAETTFYRLARLPRRLAELFAPLDPTDPDPDDVEELVPEARALIAGQALLDEWTDALYDALAPLPEGLRVRRPGAAGREAVGRREALLAVRAAWADAWTVDAVLARMRATGSVAVEARALWIHGRDVPADAAAQARIEAAVPAATRAHLTAEGALARIELGTG